MAKKNAKDEEKSVIIEKICNYRQQIFELQNDIKIEKIEENPFK